MQELRSEHSVVPTLLERARTATELARRTLEPTDRNAVANAEPLACELYRESVYWSLRAHLASTKGQGASEDAAAAVPTRDLETLWAATDQELLLSMVADKAELAELERALLHRSFVDFAELRDTEAVLLAKGLRVFAEALVRKLDKTEAALDMLLVERLVRTTLALLAVAILTVVVLVAVVKLERSRDLARDKPWKTSSFALGCTSPAQKCDDSSFFFFHTSSEPNPWLEIDLGAVQNVSSLKVVNREDCCNERAVPLAVELSVDHIKWKEVSRRQEPFTTWRPKFAASGARWVRLRALRTTMLHLSEVQVHGAR
jgi:hypothetical protein